MSEYQSIKELVIDAYLTDGGMPSYESLTEKIVRHFPSSKWQKTHYAWYKSQINTGKIDLHSNTVNSNVSENEIEESISQSIDTQVSLEKDLQQYLSTRVQELENDLVLVEGGVEYQTEAGRIDLLAKDSGGNLVVIELKAGKGKDAALGQLLGYIGCMSEKNNNVRGILVSSGFDRRVIFAAKNLSNIKLIQYELSFKLNEIK